MPGPDKMPEAPRDDLPEVIPAMPRIVDAETQLKQTPDKIRQLLPEISAAVNTWKLDHDIQTTFSREKSGMMLFRACLMYVYDNVINPSGVLYMQPYKYQYIQPDRVTPVNDGAYNPAALSALIDICARMASAEGLIFNRTLFMDLAGIPAWLNSDAAIGVTSAKYRIFEKVLAAEFSASISAAYNSEIGNIRNLNENEARPHVKNNDARRAVEASELRRLPG